MSKQKRWLIVICVLSFVLLIANISIFTPETINYQNYISALNEFNNNDFENAFHTFGKISQFSKLKPAAIYKQALCEDKLGDKKAKISKLKEITRRYPHSLLGVRAKYLKAQEFYESGKDRKAKKEFKEILNKYPNTDYAIASRYYLGAIEAENVVKIKNKKNKLKTENKAVQYFKSYLKEAPTGRFAINCVQKWVSLGSKLNNEDNMLIARVYQANQDYKSASKYLKSTNLSVSWPYFVKNAYATNDYSKVKYYTVQGLQGTGSDNVLINETINDKEENKNVYEAIDDYLKVSDDPKLSISYLLSISEKSQGHDYLLYKNCNNLPTNNQTACFNSLYLKYPKGQFAAEALANIFYDKVKSQKYFMAKKLGKTHLAKFSQTNSAPRVMFWLAKVSEKTKKYEEARNYYRTLIRQYPDDYYAYHAFLNLNRFRHIDTAGLKQKPIELPYKDSGYGLITELAKVKDYGLINQLCKDDDFVKSWLFYLQGDFSNSARIARDAIEKMPSKPSRLDPKWRLAYPIHYYNEIKQYANYRRNDPILILSIIREESYFNPRAMSAVGARGLMQLMPSTANEAARISGISLPNENLLFDPDINIRLGNIYYSRLKSLLSSKDIPAVLAYNGGIGTVSKWISTLNYVDVDDFVEQIPYAETQNYLKKVYKSYWNYLRIYDGVKF